MFKLLLHRSQFVFSADNSGFLHENPALCNFYTKRLLQLCSKQNQQTGDCVKSEGELSPTNVAELQPGCHAECEGGCSWRGKGNTKIISAPVDKGESGQRQKQQRFP